MKVRKYLSGVLVRENSKSKEGAGLRWELSSVLEWELGIAVVVGEWK